MKSLNWPMANLNPKPPRGWKVELTQKIQDEHNWSSHDYQTQTRYFLNPGNALENFAGLRGMVGRERGLQSMSNSLLETIQEAYYLANLERDYIYIPAIHTSSWPPQWISITLGGEGGYYGDLDALPSIEFLLTGGYLSKSLLKQFGVIQESESVHSEQIETVLSRILVNFSPQEVWDNFLLTGMTNFMEETDSPMRVIYFDFQQEFPQDSYEGNLSQWKGPDWYDEVRE